MVRRTLMAACGLLAAAGCEPAGQIGRQAPQDATTVEVPVESVPVKGSTVDVTLVDGSSVSGELLAASDRELTLKVGGFAEAIDADTISKVDVTLYSNEGALGALTAWAILGTSSALTHGLFFIISGPLWALVSTVSIVPVGADMNRFARVRGDLGVLHQYARFPQGLPRDFEKHRTTVHRPSQAVESDEGD